MKSVIAALLLLSFGICGAAEKVAKQVRVSLQWIEVPHPVLTEMLSGKEAGGPVLHEKAMALSEEGKARILETCMVVCPNGGSATIESIREERSPEEYDSGGLPGFVSSGTQPDPSANIPLSTPCAFDTRNTGVTFKVGTTVSLNHTIDLQLRPEMVTPRRTETWMEDMGPWGDRSFRLPTYESWKTNAKVRVESGKFELVSVITPKPDAPAPAVSRKVMVFVRADVLAVTE